MERITILKSLAVSFTLGVTICIVYNKNIKKN